MKTIGTFEAKIHLSQLLLEVESGESITITRHGKPVAVISPIRSDESIADAIELIRKTRKGVKVGKKVTIRQMIEEGRS